MSMIFPGMDPYLEHRYLWPGVHKAMIVYLSDQLNPRLGRRYVARIKERVYLERTTPRFVSDALVKRPRDDFAAENEGGRPPIAAETADEPIMVRIESIEIHEPYVSIVDLQNNQNVVTVIEVVSPSNKSGAGRKTYRKKQRETLRSDVHLVEIDLLRAGKHVLAVPEVDAHTRCDAYDYLCSVNRDHEDRSLYELYPRRLRERLPKIQVPLAEGDADAPLDLQALFEKIYERGAYRKFASYDKLCYPPLSAADQAWAAGLIEAAGLVKKSKRSKNQSP